MPKSKYKNPLKCIKTIKKFTKLLNICLFLNIILFIAINIIESFKISKATLNAMKDMAFKNR